VGKGTGFSFKNKELCDIAVHRIERLM
jgi:hypothetical protein